MHALVFLSSPFLLMLTTRHCKTFSHDPDNKYFFSSGNIFPRRNQVLEVSDADTSLKREYLRHLT